MSNHDLISALTALPERELAGVIAGALEKRDLGADPSRRRLSAAFAKGTTRSPDGCCGLTFTSHAKRIVCPLCGRTASAS